MNRSECRSSRSFLGLVCVGAACAGLGGGSQTSFAQCEDVLVASNGSPNDSYGAATSISGDVVLIGAMFDNDMGSAAGAAYVLKFNGSSWIQQQKLKASDGLAGERLGSSVGIDGSVAVVGAKLGRNSSGLQTGAAYVYRFNGSTWVQEQKLLASDGAAIDYFGSAVAISGNLVVVGAYYENERGSSAGSAYVFRYVPTRPAGDRWVQERKLTASDGVGGDYFGFSVAASGSVVVIGAYGSTDRGAAYVFRFNGSSWLQESKLLAANGVAYDFFGYSVAVSDNLAVVGNMGVYDNGGNNGSAYVFRFNGASWVQEAELRGSDSAYRDYFGASVAVSRPLTGDMVVVGAYRWPSGADVGAAYVFRKTGTAWGVVEDTKLVAANGLGDDQFGWSVGASGDRALAGKSAYNGSASVFVVPCVAESPTPCVTHADCNSSGSCANSCVSGFCQTTAAPNGTACGSSATTDCDNPDTCSNGACVPNNDPNGTLCTDDGNLCTTDTCNGSGSCTHPAKSNGTACGSSATTDCDNPDTCSSGACVPNYDPSGTLCADDLNLCTNDMCNGSGSCTHPAKANGTACGSSASTTCDNPDTCSSGTCVPNNKANGTVCTDDGNLCTSDVCGAGNCIHPAKPNGTACSDDGNVCTTDSCSSGSCGHTNVPNGTVCDDGNANTTADQCTAGICAGTPIPTNCNDGNPCTTDVSVGGVCQYTNVVNGTACGSSATTDCDNPDTCSNGSCVPNYDPNGTVCTDDGNPCTSDTCNGSGTCAHPAKSNGTACGSTASTACDNPDTCNNGTCAANNKANGTVCTDDGNLCTSDACSGGTCTHPNKANGTACGSSATTDCDNPDTCSSGTCVPNNDPSGTVCTDDANPCTNDVCNGGGSCQHVNNSNPCTDDGDSCTTDSCSAGVCQHVNNCRLPKGASCTFNSDCVSNSCKGPRGKKTCK